MPLDRGQEDLEVNTGKARQRKNSGDRPGSAPPVASNLFAFGSGFGAGDNDGDLSPHRLDEIWTPGLGRPPSVDAAFASQEDATLQKSPTNPNKPKKKPAAIGTPPRSLHSPRTFVRSVQMNERRHSHTPSIPELDETDTESSTDDCGCEHSPDLESPQEDEMPETLARMISITDPDEESEKRQQAGAGAGLNDGGIGETQHANAAFAPLGNTQQPYGYPGAAHMQMFPAGGGVQAVYHPQPGDLSYPVSMQAPMIQASMMQPQMMQGMQPQIVQPQMMQQQMMQTPMMQQQMMQQQMMQQQMMMQQQQMMMQTPMGGNLDGSVPQQVMYPGAMPMAMMGVPMFMSLAQPMVPNGQQMNGQQQSGNNMMGHGMSKGGSQRQPKPCKYFVQGHCRSGEKCKFAHTMNGERRRKNGDAYGGGRGGGKQGQDKNAKTVTLDEVKGRVCQMSSDQNGCRLLQEQLDQGGAEALEVIFEEATPHLETIMNGPFGNYLFQKLVMICSTEQRTKIVRKVARNLVAAAHNLHGTRSVQKLIEICRDQEQVELICAALGEHAVQLCIDASGNHVIQRVLQYTKPPANQFVFDAVKDACKVIGTHRHGCCVLQRCLDVADAGQRAEIVAEITANSMCLIQDPYGNYVVQYVLDNINPLEIKALISTPLGSIIKLSMQKFSSNVVEKCLVKGDPEARAAYLKELASSDAMAELVQDQYANYVIQRALSVATQQQAGALVNAMRPHLMILRHTSGGRRIIARIQKLFPKFRPEGDQA
jgi:hypothetical protein